METIRSKDYLKKLGSYFLSSILLENDFEFSPESCINYLQSINKQIDLEEIQDEDGLLLYINYLVYDNTPTISDLPISTLSKKSLLAEGIQLADELPFITEESLLSIRGVGELGVKEIISTINELGIDDQSVALKPNYTKFIEYNSRKKLLIKLTEETANLDKERSNLVITMATILAGIPLNRTSMYKNGESLISSFTVPLDRIIRGNNLTVSQNKRNDYLYSMRKEILSGNIDNEAGALLYLEYLVKNDIPTVSDLNMDPRISKVLAVSGCYLLCDLQAVSEDMMRAARGTTGIGLSNFLQIKERSKQLGVNLDEGGKTIIHPIDILKGTKKYEDGYQISVLQYGKYISSKNEYSRILEKIKNVAAVSERLTREMNNIADSSNNIKKPIS